MACMGSLDPLHYCNSRVESKRHYCQSVFKSILVLWFVLKFILENVSFTYDCTLAHYKYQFNECTLGAGF